jgi:serine/threonine-protein kinase
MNRNRFKRAEELFGQAVELSPAEREAFLERECSGDDALRREVESLLTADESAGDEFMKRSPDPGEIEAPDRGASLVGDRVDRYRVLRKIGEGGMSEVYLAVRADDEYQKRVALKVIRHGLDREDILRRFRTERQILAGLDHPNIAKLLDGGTTDDGLPYFVMDFIDGMPIDEYCDRSRLNVRERLELFSTVCSAVQYAHQNLVVHRDIKASNILVGPDGVPKLLDFGIAKLLKPDQFAEQVEYTATWIRPMTPRYASPEQIEGKPVTTASDVYSLGVLLYKLLTGHLPYDLDGRPSTELARLVIEHQPERPSQSAVRPVLELRTKTETDPDDLARARGLTREQLRRQLSGDLDNIVLMALRKEPQRRYGSVERFSEDIRRHLAGLPVEARKDTLGYRTAKFLRRNRLPVGAVAAFIVLLVGFSVAMAVLANRVAHERDQARRERDRAEQVVKFMKEIFELSDPFAEGEQRDVTAREILDGGAERVDRELDGQPLVQATLLDAIGTVYRNLGYYDRAEPLLRQAFKIRREVLGPDDPALAESLTHLGSVLSLKTDFDAARPLLQWAIDLRRSSLGANHPALAESLYEMGRLQSDSGDLEEAERLYREAIRIIEATTGDEAELTRLITHLGVVLGEKGDWPGTEAMYREVLKMRRHRYGNDHALVGESLSDLGAILGMQGKYDEAEPLLREALDVHRRNLEPGHPTVVEGLNNLAQLCRVTHRYDESELLFQEALDGCSEQLGKDNPKCVTVMANLALVLQAKGEYPRAELLAREALAIRRATFGDVHLDTGVSLRMLGNIVLDAGRPEEAQPLLRRSVEVLEAVLPDGHWSPADARSVLGECLVAEGRFEDAEPLLLAGYEGLVAARGAGHPRSRAALERIVALYDAWSKPAEAARYGALLGK